MSYNKKKKTIKQMGCSSRFAPQVITHFSVVCNNYLLISEFLVKFYTFPLGSLDSDPSNLSRSCDSTSETGGDQRSFPPGLDEALPYHIIPKIAIIMPKTTCQLRPSFPKKVNPITNTNIVFMWPSTWKVTAENLPMQMNWLRFVPIAMVQESTIKNCRNKQST